MILAKGKIAKKPYELSYLGQNIYSIEELCYVIYHNIYGINEEFFQISLAKWMKEELGLKELADKWNIEFTINISKQERKEPIKPKCIATGETLLTKRFIKLYLLEEHYFLDEYIDGITKYSIDNIDGIEEVSKHSSRSSV